MPAPAPEFPVLITSDDLLRRTHELARQIEQTFADAPPVIVAVMEGARIFANKLVRLLAGQPRYHEIRASSYGDGQVSRGAVSLGGDKIPVEGRDVLLIEDIVDTGRTVQCLRDHFIGFGAAKVEVATMLSKPSRRVVQIELDHVGFRIEDHFVIGFGMDVAGRYRELPDIAIYDEALERA